MRIIFVLVLAFLLFLPQVVTAQESKRYTFEDFMKVKWVKDPQISPNGKKILFTLEQRDLNENKTKSALWTVDIGSGELKQFTDNKNKVSGGRWSPDAKYISYTATIDGDSQIYLMTSSGKNIKKITSLANGASGAVWSADSKKILFVSEVYKDCKTEAENKKKKEELEKSKVKAKVIDELPYQVFDRWKDDKYSHLFVMNIEDLKPIDLISGNIDSPPIDLGGKSDYAFSPDGKSVCYVANTDKNIAWSTNNDLFLVDLQSKETKKLTKNPANDCGVVFSPDGRYVAYTAMDRPGFEADRRVLCVYDFEKSVTRYISRNLDRSVAEYQWTADGKHIVFVCPDEGYSSIYKVDVETLDINRLTEKTYNDSLTLGNDLNIIYFRRQSMTNPPELYSMNLSDKTVKKLTDINAYFSKIAIHKPEEFRFKASDGQEVMGFIMKPYGHEKGKKYPLIYLIHGGPQGDWSDDFHQRWNTGLFAGMGYAVAAVNFRGSVGFGQRFTDGVSKNWGGRPYEDLMNGIDYIINTYDYVDSKNMAAVGASYGGYMVNWIMGHTDRFKCAVSLSGVFNTVSEYGTTEELWFPEWEFAGTPYKNRELYEKWNPINYVNNFKTPCLVIHGEEDYRVPVSESKQLFTALKRNGVPAKFLYYPDECHFIRKPQNMQLWYKTMSEWFAQWLN